MDGINVLSLFDGMSCGQIALERAGVNVKNYFSSEIDKYAIQITQKNYPNTIQLGDVNNWRSWNLPFIDLIIGGSPCPGFSAAGKHLNFNDPRSKLFFVFDDILGNYMPHYFLYENVIMQKNCCDIINTCLCVDPIKINSSLVSAQNRNRLYWTNISFPLLVDKGLVIRDILEPVGINITDQFYEKRIGTLAYKKARLNLRTQDQKSKAVLTCQSISNTGATNIFINSDLIRKLTPVECERLQTVPDNYTSGVSNTQRYKMLGNGWTVDIITHILKGMKIEYTNC